MPAPAGRGAHRDWLLLLLAPPRPDPIYSGAGPGGGGVRVRVPCRPSALRSRPHRRAPLAAGESGEPGRGGGLRPVPGGGLGA